MECKVNQLFSDQLQVANIGLEIFAKACTDQNTPNVHVEWKPAAGGNQELVDMLSKLKNM